MASLVLVAATEVASFSPMQHIALPSPAKLNVFLHILGRRPDGYHELQTLFQLLNWSDTITLTLRADACIECDSSLADLNNQQNLMYRAAVLLQRHCRCSWGVSLRLDKRIPLGAGLGGGSSNAATTLLGLNYLWQLGLDREELASLGLQLGADVPVFIKGQSAVALGIGERLMPVKLTPSYFVVVYPDCKVPSTQIFGQTDLTRDSTPMTIAAPCSGALLDLDDCMQASRNDCEAVVMRLYPEVERAWHWLNQFGPARLTGTGACVFIAVPQSAMAHAICAAVPAPWQAFVAQGTNGSITWDALGALDPINQR